MTGESSREETREKDVVQDRPPKLNDYTYEKWKELIELWMDCNGLQREKDVVNRVVLYSLTGRTQDAVLELGQERLKSNTGFVEMMVVLDGLFKIADEKKQYLVFEELYNLKRQQEPVHEFIMHYERMCKKLENAKVTLTEPVLAYLLLKNCNISEEKESLVRATANAITLKAYKNAILNGFQRTGSSTTGASSSREMPSHSPQNVFIKEEEINFTSYNNRGTYNSRGRARGRGAYNHRGRGLENSRGPSQGQYRRGNANSQRGGRGNVTSRFPPYTCFSCGSHDHWVKDCPQKRENVYYTEYGEHEQAEVCEINFLSMSKDS